MYIEMRNAQRTYVVKIQQNPPSEHQKIHEEMDELESILDVFVWSRLKNEVLQEL